MADLGELISGDGLRICYHLLEDSRVEKFGGPRPLKLLIESVGKVKPSWAGHEHPADFLAPCKRNYQITRSDEHVVLQHTNG